MKIGSHVGNSGILMLQGSIEEALSYGANCFMVYLGAPQNTMRKPFDQLNIESMQAIANLHNIPLQDVIVHAPYIVNLARSDADKHDFGVSCITNELKGVKAIGARYLVLHPGSAVDTSVDEAINNISSGINEILENTSGDDTVILLETMAGKGNEVGRTFEEIKKIMDGISDKSRVGVCLDTCHISDAGYDLVNQYEEVIQHFDEVIGLSNLKVIHLNDSKNPCGAHKDRHENIGFGSLGFDTLYKVATDVRFEAICKILETPYIGIEGTKLSFPPYKEEIAMLKSGVFNPDLKEEVKKSNL